MMERMIQVVAVAVAAAVLSTVLRRYIPELSFLLVVCAVVAIYVFTRGLVSL